MRLFYALMRRKHMPNGHIYRGKDRIVKPILWEHKQMLRNDFEIEEKNMFYLRHPYLTAEQSSGHALALGKKEKKFNEVLTRVKEWKDDITIEQRLGHLRYREPWE